MYRRGCFGFPIEEWDSTSRDPGPRLSKRLLPPEEGGWPLLFLLFRSLPLIAREEDLLEGLMVTAVAVGKVDMAVRYPPHGLTVPQASLLDIISTFLPHFVYPKVLPCTRSSHIISPCTLPFSRPFILLHAHWITLNYFRPLTVTPLLLFFITSLFYRWTGLRPQQR